jgi:predicted glutamine amidotransferase
MGGKRTLDASQPAGTPRSGGLLAGARRLPFGISLVSFHLRKTGDQCSIPLAVAGENEVCRWVAYFGSPILVETLLYRPKHSLIDQSLHARLGPHTTNGDGFGVGWYGSGEEPALYKAVNPVWQDQNLRELSPHIRSRLIFAHIRASTGSPVQRSNCHPFRYGKWLCMHNGQIAGFNYVRRELMFAIDPALFGLMEGSTDSETFFFLALTLGLERDPPLAMSRAVQSIEQACRGEGIEEAIRMSVAVTDGEKIWAFRYATVGEPPSLYYSTRVGTLREHYPEIPFFQTLSEESRLIVSEPLGDLAGAWNEVPASSYGIITQGQDQLLQFNVPSMASV